MIISDVSDVSNIIVNNNNDDDYDEPVSSLSPYITCSADGV